MISPDDLDDLARRFITPMTIESFDNCLPDRISAGKENSVDFIYQFVKCCTKTSGENITKYFSTCHYILGKPIQFPNYGDFPGVFSMRTYGVDISISPWRDKAEVDYEPQNYKLNSNHIEIQFYESVYPIRVSIYEVYNPGNIIRIWAKIPDKDQWFLLWDGSPQTVPPASRLFSPPLASCYFKTKVLKLEFKQSSWDYYTKIDAVRLIGTSKLILPKNPEESMTDLLKRIKCMHFHHENGDVHNLTTDYKDAHLDINHLQQNFDEYCIIHKSDFLRKEFFSARKKVRREVPNYYVQRFRHVYLRHLLLKKDLKRVKLSLDEIKKLPSYSLSVLPDEIILKILQHLDLRTLCSLNQVNKRFYYLTMDSVLYKRLNVRNMCYMDTIYICNIFCYFTSRCTNLQQLDLSASEFPVSHFVKFLDDCGHQLTHLRLSRCPSINDFALQNISKICKNLKHLDLMFCKLIIDLGFYYLRDLKNLEHLNIGFTHISTLPVLGILIRTPQMRELHMEQLHVNYNAIALLLKYFNMEVINFGPFCNLTSDGIEDLTYCRSLRKLNLRSNINLFYDDSLSRLLFFCQRLEEICLCYIDLSDNRNLNSLTQCKNLIELYLYSTIFTSPTYSVIFEQCPKLQTLGLIDSKTNNYLIKQWRERYPQVLICVDSEEFAKCVYNTRLYDVNA